MVLLTSCHQQKVAIAPASLVGEWQLQTYDASCYSATGVLLSHRVSPGGATDNIIITDSTVAYFANVSSGPGPATLPGQWVARRYTQRGDTLRYDQWRYDCIVTLTSTTLTLRTSSKQVVPAYYQDADAYYARVR